MLSLFVEDWLRLKAFSHIKDLKSSPGESRKYLYNDLLELSRPLYSLSLCTRAFRLIMGEVGGMEFEDLAAAVVDWDVSLSYDLLNAIMFCLLQSEGLEGSSASSTLPARYYAAGLDAYKTRLPYGSGDSSKSGLCIAFLMFMGLAISLSRSPAFSRLVAIELDLVTFMIRIYPSFLKPKKPWSRELLRAELVLIALLNKLDPVNDYLPIARLNKVLSLTKTKDVASPSSNGLSTTLGSDALASIRSSIAYLQHTNHRMGLAEAILGQNSHSRIPSYSHLDSVYGEILELSRPAYNLSIRTRAFCLIMRDVGGMEFHEIAPAIANWPLSDLFGLLEAMLLCLKTEGNKIDIYRADKGSARLDTYHGAGLEAYIDAYDTQPRFR
ncbi:hypothetical protein BT96DRAFT_318160 [Gymnopus androsaceus JB14]|uniref:Uncharacterized protein n=1 Tax=Gymnopus androsaceus JB14 TaxID=1447944 RepID=A0A6A4H1V0_9AGAR|nr:hypothetical protein BT96DRAFT_318160 [Gymnopus androsaceus JB14]